ncbi:MAG: GDP-L-fucose synthase [Balneolaceae bacterium]
MKNKDRKIYIAGHRGMVGSAVRLRLVEEGYKNLVGQSSDELDLRDLPAVTAYMEREKPDVVIVAAAKRRGILSNNQHSYTILSDNLAIQRNLIEAAHRNRVKHLIYMGNSSVYPKNAPQPLKEESLLTGELDSSKQWYALAKIAGLKLCEALRKQHRCDYVSLVPANLYGPRDDFFLQRPHVVPGLIRKFDEAKEEGHLPVALWGTGEARREFLFVEDLADAILFVLEHEVDYGLYNVSTGKTLTILDLAETIQRVVGHEGEIEWEQVMAGGTPTKQMDVSRLTDEGWTYSTETEEGIRKTYEWYLKHRDEIGAEPA